MKKIFLIIAIALFYTAFVLAQAPQGFKYQTVVRNASGETINNQWVTITVEILQGGASGTVVCIESFVVLTNEFGLVNLEVGSQFPAAFSVIDWANGPYFIRVSLNGNIMGTSQLLSVPYALYAEKAGNEVGTGPWMVNGTNVYYKNGKVGIGTENPISSLDIRGTSLHEGILNLSDADELHGLLMSSGNNSDPESMISWQDTDPLLFASGSNGSLVGRMRITGDGNIAIGNHLPQARLDIRGTYYDDGVNLRIGSSDGVHFLNLFGGRENDPNPYIQWKSGDPLRFATDEGGWSEKMRITSDGRVGIGTDSPIEKLTVFSTYGGANIALDNINPGYSKQLQFYTNSLLRWYLGTNGNETGSNEGSDLYIVRRDDAGNNLGSAMFIKRSTGYVGIGTSSPENKLHVVGDVIIDGGAKSLQLKPASSDHVFMEFYADSDNPDTRSGYIGYSPSGSSNLRIINQMASGDIIIIPGSGGTVSVPELTITGGSDLAEPFPSAETLEAGSVVIIDELHPGHLATSKKPYDKKVAGIVSGAGGIEPGLTLMQEGVMEGTHNIALSGRVYVKASAENGAIMPGDLLTTSSLPGLAMKATDPEKSFGTVIGKSMSSLETGEGLVLVLVNLQ